MIQDIVESLTRQIPGLGVSVMLTVVSSFFGLILGFFMALGLRHPNRGVRLPAIVVVEILRGFPALLTLYIVYNGLPQIGLSLASVASAIVAFSLTTAGFTAEIFRAAIASVPRGQLEAARALGMTPVSTTRVVILPHVLRIAVPPLLGIIVIAFQGTSLAVSIGVTELTGIAMQAGQITFSMLFEIGIAAVLYLTVTSLLIVMEIWAERRARRFAGGASVQRRTRLAKFAVPASIK